MGNTQAILIPTNSDLTKLLRRRCFGQFSQLGFLLHPTSLGHWKRRLTQWWLSMKAGRREIILKQDGCQRTMWTSLRTTEANTWRRSINSSSSYPARIQTQSKLQQQCHNVFPRPFFPAGGDP